jgi:fructokinase
MILVAGESLIDLLPRTGADGEMFLAVPGGSPFNVALAVGRLGVPVSFFGGLSRDAFGDRLREALICSGVDISLCPTRSALATLGFVKHDAVTGNPRYAFYTEGTAGCDLRGEDLPKCWPASLRWVHFGSFSLATEPIGSTLEAVLDHRPPGCLIAVDPNIRPFLIEDRSAFERRWARFAEAAHLLKASEEDLAWFDPKTTPESYAAERLAAGVRLVVVTRGAAGAVAFNRAGAIAVPSTPVPLVDTVGAGDTFQAALLTWLVRNGCQTPEQLQNLDGASLRRMLQFAAAAAAITCSRSGCNPPWRSEMEDLG